MKKGMILLITATLFWAGNFICGRYLGPILPPTLLNTARWGISTVMLVGVLILQKKKLPVFKMWKEFTVLGFTGVFAFSTLTYFALTNISASQAGMISANIPIMILLFSIIILKEKFGLRAWFGAVISIIGVIILIQGKMEISSPESSIIGNIQILLASIAWGIYTVLGKRYGKKADTLTLTTGAALYGTIFSAVSCIGTVDLFAIQMTPLAWACLLYVSTFASVGAFLAWNIGVRLNGAGKSAPFLNLLPVWTVILGIIVLGEEVSWISWVGGAITISGAVLASLKDEKVLKREKYVS